MIELGLLTVLTLALVVCIILLRRSEPTAEEVAAEYGRAEPPGDTVPTAALQGRIVAVGPLEGGEPTGSTARRTFAGRFASV